MWSSYNSYAAPPPLQVEHPSILSSQQEVVYESLPHGAQYTQYHTSSHVSIAPSGMWRYPSSGVVSDARALEMMHQSNVRDSYPSLVAEDHTPIDRHSSSEWAWNPYQQPSIPTQYEHIPYHHHHSAPEPVPQPPNHYFAQPNTPSPESPGYPIYSEPDPRLDVYQSPAAPVSAHSPAATPRSPPLRAFPCDQCDRSFSRAYDLSRHRKTHSEDKHKRHQCSTCEKSFTRSDALKRHAVNSQCGVIRPLDGSNRHLA